MILAHTADVLRHCQGGWEIAQSRGPSHIAGIHRRLVLKSSASQQGTLQVRITMIGGGYVGLVSGACFAEFGSEVTVVEAESGKLAALHQGRMPIYEPGLEKLVKENVAAGR